ncbi:hypothetical protein EA794_04355 [Lactococcus petauri]|uniref:hypothetical protein n=1 Tax=Lactococcus petauri TaxID=1940789 RepID=UPI0013FE0895|nr:hypothetical protein [Lactococcus petauri]NHI75212.1 hypothetical protein [Lactococcus petauri]
MVTFSIFIPIILIGSMIIYGLFITKYRKIIRQSKKDRDKLVRETFPNLSPKDIKYRKASINLYLRWYFYSPAQRILSPILGLGLILDIVGLIIQVIIVFNNLNDDNSTILVFNFFLLFLFIVLAQLITPRFENQNNFLKKYLEENPSNDLRVIVFEEDYAKKVTKAKIQSDIFLIFVTIIYLLLTIYFWYFSM